MNYIVYIAISQISCIYNASFPFENMGIFLKWVVFLVIIYFNGTFHEINHPDIGDTPMAVETRRRKFRKFCRKRSELVYTQRLTGALVKVDSHQKYMDSTIRNGD
jgi:hypothetical protein